MRLLTPQEAHKKYGLNVRTLQDLARHGRIRHMREGRRIRFHEKDLIAYIKSRTIEPVQPIPQVDAPNPAFRPHVRIVNAS